jgi:hypothetical protein
MSGRYLQAIGALILLVLTGCGSQREFEYDSLHLTPADEELTEFSLGEYHIPIPVVEDRTHEELSYRNRFEFTFNLHALISPSAHSQISDVWSRHEGKIRDQIIRVCRNATVDELQEPELATLKARLMDALANQMGGQDVRQLLFTEVVSQEL